MRLQEHFEKMMQQAWPQVPKGHPQWYDLENAFFGGALVALNHMHAAGELPEEHGIAHLADLDAQIKEHHRKTHSRVTLVAAIITAGRKPPDEPKM